MPRGKDGEGKSGRRPSGFVKVWVLVMNAGVTRANAIMVLLFAMIVLLQFDTIRDRFFPPMYDDARSFSRVDPQPGWIDTGITITESQPIGIIASGRIATPRLTHTTAGQDNKTYDVGPEGAQIPEDRIPDWREEDNFRAFALLGRVNGGKPFLVGRTKEVAVPGKLELKVNCLLWDKAVRYEPGTIKPRRRRGPLTAGEVTHLRMIRGFFAYRTWQLGTDAPPREPHLPKTAAEISKRYGAARPSALLVLPNAMTTPTWTLSGR